MSNRRSRLWRTFRALSCTVADLLLRPFGMICSVSGATFLLCAADRCGLLDALDAVPDWIMTTSIVAESAVLLMILRKLPAPDLLQIGGYMLRLSVVCAPAGYAGAAFTFPKGCAVFLSAFATAGVAVFVMLPLLAAVKLIDLHEGDALLLRQCDRDVTWFVLTPFGDGNGLLACSFKISEEEEEEEGWRTITEQGFMELMLTASKASMASKLGPVETVARILMIRMKFPWFGDELLAAALRLQRPVRVIQRTWRRACSDPNYALCRTRLLREAHDLAHDMA
jgi:hypothetical protein